MLSKFLAFYAHFSWLILFVFQAHEGTLNSGAHQPRFIEPMYAGAVRELPDSGLWCYDGQKTGRKNGSLISSDLAMSRNLAGGKPAQVTASHGPGIQPCSQIGDSLIDA